MSKRLARLSEQLKRELSEMIRLQVRDPRVGSVTITGVDVAGDLGVAWVFVRSMVGDDLVESLEGLEAAAPFLRTSLGKVLHVRRVPELRFQEDRSHVGAQRIEQVLAEVLPEDEADADAEADAGDDPDVPVAGDAEDEIRRSSDGAGTEDAGA